jgi:hypothetical protein
MRVEAAGIEIGVPLEGGSHRETIETDVFGTKDDPASNDAQSGNETGGDAATGDDDASDGDETATSTDETATEDGGSTTSDGDSTTTDDGGVIPSVVAAHARATAP